MRAQRIGKANPAEDEAVYQAILRALLEGKLKAGTKLAETPLAAIFGVMPLVFFGVGMLLSRRATAELSAVP